LFSARAAFVRPRRALARWRKGEASRGDERHFSTTNRGCVLVVESLARRKKTGRHAIFQKRCGRIAAIGLETEGGDEFGGKSARSFARSTKV